MSQFVEMAIYIGKLSKLLVKAVNTLHCIAEGKVDNPQRLAKKTLKHLNSEFKSINAKTEKKLTAYTS